MTSLKDIKVVVKGTHEPSGNALALLHEIHHALTQLLKSSQETIIDLQSIPLSPSDETQLFNSLGKGEIEVHLNVLGKSIIQETGTSGVWLIKHFNEEEQPVGKYIEITQIPSILKSQFEDIEQGLKKLASQLTGSIQN